MIKTSEIARKMCRSELSPVDIKAICKARGFSEKDAGSLGVFENFLLSDIGVADAMESLERREILTLHFLRYLSKPVRIDFFERMADGPVAKYGSFTQQYKGLFKQIQTSLVRKGILFFSESSLYDHLKSKLEKYHFVFPEEFHRLLPSPFQSILTVPDSGEENSSVLREKLSRLIRAPEKETKAGAEKFMIHLVDGRLRIGDEDFRLKTLEKWRRAQWDGAFTPGIGATEDPDRFLSPLDAVSYTLSRLGPGAWASPDDLEEVLKICCKLGRRRPAADEICRKGYESGSLARLVKGGKTWYRPARCLTVMPEDHDPGAGLRIERSGDLRVNLETIPVQCLELLARISRFRTEDHGLTASPDRIRIGRVIVDIRQTPLFRWLAEKPPAFRDSIRGVQKHWGKQIVHRDLLVAKVKNLSLRVAIEKEYAGSEKVVFLPNDFIAFPMDLLSEIGNLVTRSGFAVKTVEAS